MNNNEEYIVAQQSALAEYERKKREQAQDRLRLDRESEALAKAVAASEWDEAAVDAEKLQFAQILEDSARQAEIAAKERALEEDTLRRKRARAEERNQGCWDCQICTFTNRPYNPSCQACDAVSPPSVLTFQPVSPSRFGVEIEIIIPDGKRDGYSLQSISQELSRIGPPEVVFMGYSHETTQKWKMITDNSLRGSDRDLCFELVSPVLQHSDGLASMRCLLENVRKLGISTNTTCGFHVHVDATAGPSQAVPLLGSLNGIRNIARNFVALENAFDLLVANQRRRGNDNTFCKSNRLELGSLSNRQRWERMSHISSIEQLVRCVSQDRYKKLNLTNLSKPSRPSTIEFRQHGGVQALLEAEAWVRLVLRFCEKSCQDTSARCLLPERATARDELWVLFDLLECTGLEQYYATEKMLFREDRLSNEWSCRFCERSFQSCRALSQHQHATGHSS